MATMTAQTGEPVKLGGRVAWTALILVALTQAMSMVDRQILAILAPRIKEDLQIGDAELGMLYGTVFAVFYALFSLPLGRLADGWIRTRILAIAITGWSVMTGLAGFAQNFATLAVTRLGVGIGEASVMPAGMSMLTDMFPREKRGLVSALLAAAIALGLGGSMWLGGTVADGWDAAYPRGTAPLGLVGWQAAFVVAAIPGLFLGAALLFLPEPKRGVADGIEPPPDPHVFRESSAVLMQILPGFAWLYLARMRAPARVWVVNIAGLTLCILLGVGLTRYTNALRPSDLVALKIGALELGGNAMQWSITAAGLYILLCWTQSLRLRDRVAHAILLRTPALNAVVAVAVLQTIVNYALMGWTATYLVRRFDQSLASVGFTFGLVSAAIGILGPLIGGPVSDFFRTRHPSGRLYVLLLSMVLSPFAAIITYRADSLTGFYLLFVLLSIIVTLWLPPIYASIMDLVLPRMRGTMMSYYTMITTILGLGLGPYAVGLISDITGDLGGAIVTMYWVNIPIVLLTLYAIVRLPRDEAAVLERARAAGEPI
jgi:MFS transporter, Spinster family, sphingosine-1-phosphate transporter